MNPKTVARLTARVLALVAALMLAPVALALVDGDGDAIFAYLASLVAVLVAAVSLNVAGRGAPDSVHTRTLSASSACAG